MNKCPRMNLAQTLAQTLKQTGKQSADAAGNQSKFRNTELNLNFLRLIEV